MPTALQAQANRRNGALSAGPNLPGGKTISLTNGTTHGCWARNAVRSPHDDPPPTTAGRKIEKLTKQTQSHFWDKSPKLPRNERLRRWWQS
jgi:hypothetical protein